MRRKIEYDYGLTAKLLHWVMAVLFLMMFVVAYIMINLPKSAFRLSLYNLHKATGLLLFGLFVVRFLRRFFVSQPAMPVMPRWQQLAVHSNIFLLYCLMLTMPVTGFLTSTLSGHDVSFYGWASIPALANNVFWSGYFSRLHERLSWLLAAAFTLHVLGAFYHHYFLRDNVLKRMWIR